MNGTYKYLYGIIPFSEKNSVPAVADGSGKETHEIVYRDMACVVSDSRGPTEPADRKALIQALQSHQAVMERLIKDGVTIIPIKFGTYLGGEKAVENALEAGYGEFSRLLDSMSGKMEVNVTAEWRSLETLLREIAEENPEISMLKKDIAGKTPDEAFALKVRIGSAVKSALDRKREDVKKRILESLRKVAVDARLPDGTGDSVILTAAFLIERSKENFFDEALNGLNGSLNGSVDFKYISPLPPYSFCTMEVKEVGYEDIRKAKELLGLGDEATAVEIRDCYQKKALAYHPDRERGNPLLGAMFEDLTKAYRLLNKFCRDGKCPLGQKEVEGFFYVEAVNL
ncbi:MAG: GvpL/GvpF family gas vesicle protein [Deltaproteobacteria bacterium]|nr:GvpL/GvpF family gas vesicle protein [Deltaproteobacteria bacterium]